MAAPELHPTEKAIRQIEIRTREILAQRVTHSRYDDNLGTTLAGLEQKALGKWTAAQKYEWRSRPELKSQISALIDDTSALSCNEVFVEAGREAARSMYAIVIAKFAEMAAISDGYLPSAMGRLSSVSNAAKGATPAVGLKRALRGPIDDIVDILSSVTAEVIDQQFYGHIEPLMAEMNQAHVPMRHQMVIWDEYERGFRSTMYEIQFDLCARIDAVCEAVSANRMAIPLAESVRAQTEPLTTSNTQDHALADVEEFMNVCVNLDEWRGATTVAAAKRDAIAEAIPSHRFLRDGAHIASRLHRPPSTAWVEPLLNHRKTAALPDPGFAFGRPFDLITRSEPEMRAMQRIFGFGSAAELESALGQAITSTLYDIDEPVGTETGPLVDPNDVAPTTIAFQLG